MKQSCIVNAQKVMKMSFPQSLSGNPEDKRTGFRVKHGMTARRGFSGKVSSSKSQVPSFQTPNYSLFTDKKGFTVIETIVVMVIIAILAAVVIVRNPFDSIKLYSATRKVAGDIRYAQKLAISNQTRAGIEFNTNGYCVFRDITLRTGVCTPTNALAISPGDTCSSDPSNNFVVDFTASRCNNYQNVQITTLPVTNPIAFNSLGTPVDSGGATLGANQFLIITYSGTKQINIEANTGRVSIQ